MTEQEAKTKWCPMTRVIMTPQDHTWQNQALTNRMQFVNQGNIEALCIGYDCMMWRWLSHIMAYDEEYRQNNPSCKERYPLEKREGYCGLGGKP